ncbi:uncharacterized protein LOC127288118 [Leptopilina boulardi]|uniref:uncharacterized protein LOC127288118 n=1 Tax=Leptopilina boulardi TaxID=63433 RepID=UPI0021F566C8|nr:uncharacterized protein LOC127288118 [Leptopilina boulardi]
MSLSEPKRKKYMSQEQKELLIGFMINHPKLQTGKFNKTFTVRDSQRLWQEVTQELHKIPGPTKDWKQWRKTWQDLRSLAKCRGTGLKDLLEKMNKGSEILLSQNNKKEISLKGSTTVHFSKNVRVPEVIYSWDSKTITEENSNFECLDSDEELVRNNVAHEKKRHVNSVWQAESVNIKKEKLNEKDNKMPKRIENVNKTEITQLEYYKEKCDYYKKKLKILERDVIAKEQLSKGVQELCTIILQKFSK